MYGPIRFESGSLRWPNPDRTGAPPSAHYTNLAYATYQPPHFVWQPVSATFYRQRVFTPKQHNRAESHNICKKASSTKILPKTTFLTTLSLPILILSLLIVKASIQAENRAFPTFHVSIFY